MQSNQKDVLLPLLGKKEGQMQFREEQSTLWGTVPTFSLHRAQSEPCLAAALFCHGPWKTLKCSSSEAGCLGITQ